MSASDRPVRTPLGQQQPSGIRVVPYSPARPSDASEDTASVSARPQESNQLSTDDDRHDRSRTFQSSGKASTTSGQPNRGSSAAQPGPSTPDVLLAKRGDGPVSGPDSHTNSGTSFNDARLGGTPTVIPVPNVAGSNAPARGRLSTASYTTHTSQSSRQSTASHLSDVEGSSPSVPSSPPSGPRRPASRRRNFVAVLNEDKTFSLVPQRHRETLNSQSSESQNPPRSSSALSEYSGPAIRSSQLPSFPTTPRVSQASSHEGIPSYASSHYDRPGSSLTSTGTIPDRSITPATPVPSSPGGSTVQESVTEDPIAESTPWNYRIRKVSIPSDPNRKGKQPSTSSLGRSDTTETPLPALLETTSPSHDVGPVESQSPGEEQASIHSTTSSSESDANWKVYRPESEGPVHSASVAEAEQGEQSLDESQLDPQLREQTSFASAQTTSTDFESSNYKVYSHSDSEESERGRSESPVAGPSFAVRRSLQVPQLEPQTSFGSIQSTSALSDSSNYKVYGPPSPSLPPVPETDIPQDTYDLRPAPSFLSAVSTLPEGSNWQVYGRHSPAALSSVDSFNPPSPSGSQRPLLGSPTRAHSPYTREEQTAPPPVATEPNYVLHGDPSPDHSPDRSPDHSPDHSPNHSPATSESGGTVLRHPQEEYSQESLVIPPLRPRLGSEESIGYYRARSRSISNPKSTEDLKAKKSTKSFKSSVSSIINEETSEAFFTGQAFLNAPVGQYESPSVAGPSERQRQLDQQREQERQQRERAAAWAEESGVASGSEGSMALPTTPHQWSSQLSTVMSETEPDSSNGTRASLASVSLPGSHGSHGRRSSRGWSSSHSRQMLSISSSLAGELENTSSRSRSNSHDSPDRPSPAYRNGFQGRVRHHDEDGDGLADLHQITPRPSRSRLSDFFNHPNASDRNLHSSASSASNSFNSANIPLWAKLYYGSGERRWLRSYSISSMSDLGSRPTSMQHSGSPATDRFPGDVHSPRRRPGEEHGNRQSYRGSMNIEPLPADLDNDHVFRRSLRRMTSSIWSPHLRRDVRAQNRYSIWDTPSVAWSAESGMFGRRNIQVVLFVVGFIFPFAWMIGAVLPLPKPSPLAMIERETSYSDLGARTHSHEYERHIESEDELRYQNARWWRLLNRCMSVIGLLIIGAVIGLVIASIRQGWGTTRT